MEKTIAVIVPCFSYGHFLAEALESLAQQTRIPDEIIIVSDGAIDNSVQVAKEFKDKHKDLNVIIIEKENGGLASARNTGVKIAKSKYIMSFDSDDILRPQAIEKHLELADEQSIVTLPLMAFGSESYTARPREATVEILLQTNVIYSNSLFPKELWKRVGGFDESETMRLGLEDWLWNIECACVGAKFKTGDYVALLWRRHPKTMSENSANPNWDKITKYMMEKIKTKYNL